MTSTTQQLQTALLKMDELGHRLAAAEAREARERGEAKARADAARHLTSREHLMELDAEKRKLQARCDDALQTWGIRAPAPVIDEPYDDYRWRLVKLAQKRLPDEHQYRKTKLGQFWNNGFETVENQIYRDVRAAGERPDSAPQGELRQIEKTGPNGVKTVEFRGSRSFIDAFRLPGRRVKWFRTDQGYLNTSGSFLR
jgi:hypothetical protein